MSDWLHLNLTFKDYADTVRRISCDAALERPTGVYRELIHYLKKVVDSLLPGLIKRYFYFFEPNPHLFLALEVKDMRNIDLIRFKIKQIDKPNFIDSATIDLDCHDETNGEAAIDFFYAGTKYAFFRISDEYRPEYLRNNEVKLVHCFCNQLFVEPSQEIVFYTKCLQLFKLCKE